MYSQSYYSVLKSFGISFRVDIQPASFRIRFICFILFLGIAFFHFNFVTCPLIPDYVLHFYSLDYIINYSYSVVGTLGRLLKGTWFRDLLSLGLPTAEIAQLHCLHMFQKEK